jgi:hypothetical protein
MMAQFSPRRLVANLGSRIANRRFAFAVVAIAMLGAKILHIYAHHQAVSGKKMALWGYSFFAQDTVLLVLIRSTLEPWPAWIPVIVSRLALALSATIATFVLAISIVSSSFFVASGSEMHWRNIGFASDPSSRALLLTGIFSLFLVVGIVLFLSYLLQDFVFAVFGFVAGIITWPVRCLHGIVRGAKRPWHEHFIPAAKSTTAWYSEIPQNDGENGEVSMRGYDDSPEGKSAAVQEEQSDFLTRPARGLHRVLSRLGPRVPGPELLRRLLLALLYLIAAGLLITQVAMFLAQPGESSLSFMSWTPALLPFVDFSHSAPSLRKLKPVFGTGIQTSWDKFTSLADPPKWSWMPKDQKFPGFDDWNKWGKKHYSAAADPLKLSNMDDDLIPSLRDKLAGVPIRHVVLLFLESTRQDVFPMKNNTAFWDRMVESMSNNQLTDEMKERLATLTPTANYLTGDYNDGFEHEEKPVRGGLSMTNAITTATYTLKSMTGSLCGVTPFAVDFNQEASQLIYQPCLPHLFETFSRLDGTSDHKDEKKEKGKKERDADAHEFSSYKWRSRYMQTSTMEYDKSRTLLDKIGFERENVIGREYLRSDDAKFGPITLPLVNYFAFEEEPLQDYIRDAFVTAKEENERVFLTHLTSTTHHSWQMPEDAELSEDMVTLGDGLADISRYLNVEGYGDRWIKRILDILDDEEVADETLVVLVGDHGVSLPENDKVASYYNPHVANDHVPLVLSHPKLPPVTIDDPVVSLQILPTILDLLIETGSLSGKASKAASDLVRNYEGQSMLRPHNTGGASEKGHGDWQFTIINPGGAQLASRDARHPERRLVAPVVSDVEWQYSDIDVDPLEKKTIKSFEFGAFIRQIEKEHGEEVAKWAEEAAFISRWWVEENNNRWLAWY